MYSGLSTCATDVDVDVVAILNFDFLVSECVFGRQILELGSQWVPDLGVPIGVQYCFKCECVPVSTP